jgi:hypothetical protein
MPTARTLITKALRKARILTLKETPTADEASDALESLNDMLGSWSNNSVDIVSRTLESFPMVAGQSTYTIGSGGDFDTVRPSWVVSAYFTNGNVDYSLRVVTDEAYANISFKGIQGFPDFLNYTAAFPLAQIKIYPTPASAYTLNLLTEKTIESYSTLDTNIDLPAGWERAIVYNLAIDLSSDYGQAPSQEVVQIAYNAMESIERAISRNRTFDSQPTAGTRNNILTGWGTR